MKKVINLAIISLMVVALPFAVNFAFGKQANGQSQNSNAGANANYSKPTQEEKDAKKADNQANKDAAATEKCKNTETKLTAQMNTFQINQQNRVRAYEQINNKLDNLVANLKKQGYDTADLEAAVAEFKTQAQNFYAEHERLMTQLKNTQNYTCGDAQQFKGELKKAREQLRIAHQERLKLRQQFVSEIRPALLELRNQIQNQNSTGATGSLETTTTQQ